MGSRHRGGYRTARFSIPRGRHLVLDVRYFGRPCLLKQADFFNKVWGILFILEPSAFALTVVHGVQMQP